MTSSGANNDKNKVTVINSKQQYGDTHIFMNELVNQRPTVSGQNESKCEDENEQQLNKNINSTKFKKGNICKSYDKCLINIKCNNINANKNRNMDSHNNNVSESTESSHVGVLRQCIHNTYEDFIRICSIKKNNIIILNLNAQGLLEGNHFEQMCTYINDNRIDIISVEETWLNTTVNNKSVDIEGYKICRSDRNLRRAKKKKGGGVCMYVRNDLKFNVVERKSISKYTLIDYIIMEVIFDKYKFLFCNFYRHCDNPDNDTNEIFERVIEISQKYENVIICGDFNANFYDNAKYRKLQVISDAFVRINDDCPTYSAGDFAQSQIDYIFMKNANMTVDFGHFPAIGISNHQAIYGIFKVNIEKRKSREYVFRNFRKYDDDAVESFAQSINWNQIIDLQSVDSKIDALYEIMYHFIDKIFPEKRIISRYNPVKWMTAEIKQSMDERKVLYDLKKINRTHHSYKILCSTYKTKDGMVRKMIRQSKRNTFIKNYALAENSREKWKLIHSFGVTRKSRKNFEVRCNDIINPNTLNNEFNRLGPLPKSKMSITQLNSSFKFEHVTAKKVAHTISSIKSEGMGPDSVPPICFKLLKNYISETIASIINTSFDQSFFPSRLKNVVITPLPKIDEPTLPTQYRPISNANFLLKIISKITCGQLTKYVEVDNILCEQQSGFREKHSCTTAILSLTEKIHDTISRGKCIILVLLDFSNAFGSVDHDKLLQVLESIGVRGREHKWFSNFIAGWKQTVRIESHISDPLVIKRGIIQGENNSQLLFSIFINNITKYIKNSESIIFADDVQLFIESDVNQVDTAIARINDDLMNIGKFSNEYGLTLNAKKSGAIVISSKHNLNRLQYENISKIRMGEEVIEYSNSIRDLGYFLNRYGSNDEYIKVIMRKGYGSLNSLQHLRKTLPEETKLQLIKSLVLPIIDYMDVVYHCFDARGSGQMSNRLEKLQNSCIRFVKNIRKSEHITQHRNDLNLLTLNNRRIHHVASMIYKILNGKAPPYLDNLVERNSNRNIPTRIKNRLKVQRPGSEFHRMSFFVGAPKIWNEIPDVIKSCETISAFNDSMKIYLLNKQSGNISDNLCDL